MSMPLTTDDLSRMAALGCVVIPRTYLERLVPSVAALHQDLDRLRALPIGGMEPAFTPEPRTVEAPDVDGRTHDGDA
jgi:hypothetical protein